MGNKVCRRCSIEKPITEFYEHAKMLDGHLNICKDCVKFRVKKYRQENDSVREYDRFRYHNDPIRKQKTAETARKWNERNREGYVAHYTVSNAIRDKRLKRMPCIVCGDPKGHAHHEDYSKPLEIIWLCSIHHHRLHSQTK
jgi:hypothetical protein